MIIIGYQGIGKSTLAKQESGYIDLESSNFRINGERPPKWYVYYCRIAEDLSRQGYTVFVSCHKEVREFLKNSSEFIVLCFPAFSVKDKWIEKLRRRFERTKREKDKRAWVRASANYYEDISDLISYTYDNGFNHIEINDADRYNLKLIIENFSDFHKEDFITFNINDLVNLRES